MCLFQLVFKACIYADACKCKDLWMKNKISKGVKDMRDREVGGNEREN